MYFFGLEGIVHQTLTPVFCPKYSNFEGLSLNLKPVLELGFKFWAISCVF